MASLVALALNLFVLAIFARMILSWFPLSPGSPMIGIYSFLYSVTEPVLGPVRRMLPSLSIDLSPLIVILVIRFIGGALGRPGVL